MISTARSFYIQRLGILKHTLAESIVQDRPPTDVQHNERARFLRNGLAIISFNILEDFFKSRIAEVLQHIVTSPVGFNRLPAKLQEAALLHSLVGIDKVAKRMKSSGADWRTFVQTQTQLLSSSTGIPYGLSGYGMGFQKSNLDANDVPEFMGNFHIDGGWASIEHVTTLVGCTVVAARQVFFNAANRRHAAAHDPNSHIPFTDVEDFITHAKAIALAFDLLISQAAHNLKNSFAPYIAGTKITPGDLRLRFIRKIGAHYNEMNVGNSTVIKRCADEATAVASLRARRNYSGEMIVVVDYPSKAENWYTAF
ncbi:MAG: hypothetical protein J7621_16730 [Niastella sp.]|nr:hypothetical protein [Niastella sp.]